MDARLKEIGARLKGLRAAVDMEPEELAEKAGVSVQDLRQYESGQGEIPVSHLMRLARACGVGLTVLLTGDEARLSSYCRVERGRGLSVDRRKDYDYRNLAYMFAGRKMEPFLITAPPKPEGEGTFTSHSGQEFIHLLEGRLEVTLAEEKVVLEQGDSLYFDSSTPHSMRGLDNVEAVFLDVII